MSTLHRIAARGVAMCAVAAVLTACSHDRGDDPAPTQGTAPAARAALWRSHSYVEGTGEVDRIGRDILALTPTSTTRVDSHGHVVWSVREPTRRRAAPEWLVAAGDIMRFSRPGSWSNKSVRVLDGRTGKVLWTRTGLHPQAAGSRWFFATRCADAAQCRVIALDATTGAVRWRVQVPGVARLAMRGSTLIVTSYPNKTASDGQPAARRGHVDLLDPATGRHLGRPISKHGHTRRPLASAAGVTVRLHGQEAVATRSDGSVVWRTPAPGTAGAAGHNLVAITVDQDGFWRTEIRTVSSGAIVLRVSGEYISSGPGWMAVQRYDRDSQHKWLAILPWRH